MEGIKRLTKILNIELVMIVVFVMLIGGGIFWVFYQHSIQSEMTMSQIKDEGAMRQLMDMDRFISVTLGELFLFFLLLSAAFIVISRKFSMSFIKSIVIDLTNKAKELEDSQEALQEAKTVLEIKVQARTKELRELAESLENKVEERTRELKARLEELERFQSLTIGRELKMTELKKEIEKLKELEKDNQSR